MRRISTLVFFVLGGIGALNAQDIVYSQFYNVPFLVSPGLTGVFHGDFRLAGVYGNQWNTVPVNYNTFGAGFDARLLGKRPRRGYFSVGLLFNYDQAGFTGYYNTMLKGVGSYTHRWGRQWYGTFGVGAGWHHEGFNPDKVTLDEHFNSETGLPVFGLPVGEEFPTDRTHNLDLSAGFNIRYQALQDHHLLDRLEQRTKIDFGFGMYHLNRPDKQLIDTETALTDFRLSPYILSVIQVGKNLDLIGNALVQIQKPHNQYVFNAGVRTHINRHPGKQFSVQFTLGARFQEQEVREAIIPGLELFYNDFRFGFTYDINISDFSVATSGVGGPEVSLSYIFKRVHPLPVYKACPLL